MTLLERTINEAFNKAYPDSPPVFDEALLVKRVNMLIDDLLCTRVNWHISERAYNRLDREKRGLRWHWWQFWKPKHDRGVFK